MCIFLVRIMDKTTMDSTAGDVTKIKKPLKKCGECCVLAQLNIIAVRISSTS